MDTTFPELVPVQHYPGFLSVTWYPAQWPDTPLTTSFDKRSLQERYAKMFEAWQAGPRIMQDMEALSLVYPPFGTSTNAMSAFPVRVRVPTRCPSPSPSSESLSPPSSSSDSRVDAEKVASISDAQLLDRLHQHDSVAYNIKRTGSSEDLGCNGSGFLPGKRSRSSCPNAMLD